MALIEVAVDGCTLALQTEIPPITGAGFAIVSIPSTKVKAESKGVFSGGIDFKVSACIQAT